MSELLETEALKALGNRLLADVLVGDSPEHFPTGCAKDLRAVLVQFQQMVYRYGLTPEENDYGAKIHGEYLIRDLTRQYEAIILNKPLWLQRDFIKVLEETLCPELWALAYAYPRLPIKFDLEHIFQVLNRTAEVMGTDFAASDCYCQSWRCTITNLSLCFRGTNFLPPTLYYELELPHCNFVFLNMFHQGWIPPIEMIPYLVECQLRYPVLLEP